ncbi:MAG: alpha-L-glutamate ligase-like protein [Gammaproteobacteria bacterium]|nr:alpha-L-glutamate ligase-like protein [Gammaproteobacteria bacterium]
MNRRNVAYIARYNDRRNYPMVDNKLTTKLISTEAGIAVPDLIAVVRTQHEIEQVHDIISELDEFVAKPAQGSGGRGILVVVGKNEDGYLKANGETVGLEYVKRHLTNTISGLHSLGGRNDVAFLEELVKVDEYFAQYSFEGVPDIRLIVFKGFPVMGMLRLATKASDGKANLHQGAIGVGLDLASGKAIRAIQYERLVTHHPDTGKLLSEIQIPGWASLLHLATQCYEVTGLGYLGCDIVIDRTKGPLILELNARPGLSIQIANNTGLLPRLTHLEEMDTAKMVVEDRVNYAIDQFHHFAVPVTEDILEPALDPAEQQPTQETA